MKKKKKVDKQSWANFVLSFTLILVFVSIFAVTKELNSSYALPTDTGDPMNNLTFSGQVGISPAWNFLDTTDLEMNLTYDFKAKDANNNEYDMYCIEGQKGLATTDTYNSPEKMNASYATGMAWLLNNSYPIKANSEYMSVCATNNNCKKYITQFAVWYYLDKLGVAKYSVGPSTNLNQLTNEQKTKLESLIASNNIHAVAINNLVNAAISHNNNVAANISIDKNKIQWTVESDYVISNEIAVNTNKADFMTGYSINITGNTYDAVLVDLNNNVNTNMNFTKDSKFKIKVPLNKIKDAEEFNLNLIVNGKFNDTVYEYQSTGGNQRPIVATLLEVSVPLNLNIPLTQITKSDITNGKPVEGAVLVIKDNNGNEIASWTTDKNPHYVSLNPGDYTLTETTSPDGYELNKETVPFTVANDGKITKVEMKNTPTTPVPNTASNIPMYIYIIGAIILAIGGVIVYVTVKPKKK